MFVLYETIQTLFKFWNLVIVFKQFYKHAKPVMWSAGLYKCHSFVKVCTNRHKKNSQGIFYCNPSLTILGSCGYDVTVNLCGNELGLVRQDLVSLCFHLVVLHSKKFFFKRSRGIERSLSLLFLLCCLDFLKLNFLILKLQTELIVSFSVIFVYIYVLC